jgi:long-chain acyl-CoA synthetase
MADALDIAGSLRGERIFVTGATGFVGKVLVEKLLWSVPEVGRLLLLVRPGRRSGAGERLRDEVLASPVMARLRARHGDGWESWAAGKVEAVAGDLGRDRFGLDEEAYGALCRRVDRLVASAATVTFDERLDRAVELNARGALRALDLARDAGGVPLVHVSTCFVSGRRCGPVPERLEAAAPDGGGALEDPEATLAALDEACRRLRAEPGGDADAGARLVAAGAEQAARFGFHDVYTLTKALGERLVARGRGALPVAIVRPAIVESALAEPIPGWLETIRVADPLLVAYGRGRTHEIPGTPDVPLELVPVDLVVNALLAALAELRRGGDGGGGGIRVYQVGSSRNPITLGELIAHAREGFARTPLRGERDEPIAPGEPRFTEPDRLRRRLAARRRRLGRLDRTLARLGATRFAARLGVADRTLEHFGRLIEVYRPYLSRGASYQDEATRGLWSRLTPAARAAFPFDVAAIDWRGYVARVHVPGIVRFALKAESGAPPPATEPPAPHAERRAEAEAHAEAATTLFGLFAGVARAHPEVVAFQTFRDGRWLRYTYGQALTATANVARRLAADCGIGRGDRVVLWAGGCPEWAIAAFAVHRLGAAIVPLDPQWPAAEVAQAARLVGAKLICAAPRLLAEARPALAEAGCPAVALGAPFVPEPDVGLLPGADGAGDAGGPDDLASILFTSGTTVSPKAVPLTHANYLANVRDLVPLMDLSRERLLSVLPIHHAFEQTVGLLVPLAGASTISYVAEIRPAEISWMMATTRPTVMVAVPRLLELLHGGIFASVEAGGPALRALFRVLFALSRVTGARWGHRLFGKVHRRFGGSLRRIATGGSALEPGLGRSFQLMGFAVAEGYGMTETAPVLTVNPWRAIRFGSAGRPLPGVEFELRPPAEAAGLAWDRDVGAPAARRTGEIWVRGANVMAGYHDNPEATAEVLRDGWLNTGDLGWFDADGYLHLAGRTKDVIVTDAGKNVYPEEVELRYRGLPGVAELVVLGLPPPGGEPGTASGERVAAVIVPRQGTGDEEVERIRDAIAARSAEVPSYQRISRLEIWRGELPKTTTLKVRRGLLRDAVLAGERSGGEKPAPPAPAADRPPPSPAEAWAIATLARLTRTRPDQLRPGDRLADLGIDSLTRVELIGTLEARRGRRLDDATAGALERVQDLFDLA